MICPELPAPWQVITSVVHKQARLLRRMLDSGLEAILVKIAAIGARRWYEIVAILQNHLAFCWPHWRCVCATASATKRDGSVGVYDANDTNTQAP